MKLATYIAVIFWLYNLNNGSVHAADKMWREQAQKSISPQDQTKTLRATANNARYLNIDSEVLAQMQTQISQNHTLQLPLPNGQWVTFTLAASPILSTPLASKYPELMTYSGEEVDKPQNYGRFSLSPQGFFGFFQVENEWFLLSPEYRNSSDNYVVYRYKDATETLPSELLEKATETDFLVIENTSPNAVLQQKAAPTGEQIRTYRLAISTTGEYAQKQGGSVADVVAESMIVVNRINQILLTDLAVQFELIDSEAVIFTDPQTDPYTNSDAATDIDINQTTLNNLIGQANYDIGHLLTTTGGGLAGVSVVCRSNSKALGTSGATNPSGERFYIDLLTHEIGHQLGARHSFNAQDESVCDASQRNAQSAFEPGGGSTIMSYAGLCSGQNLQTNSDPYFHGGSIEEIRNYVESFSGSSCGTVVQQNNAIPQIQLATTAYTIPANTPFVLNATANDADNDTLFYNWDQVNAGGLNGGTANSAAMRSDNGNNPLFRSFPDSLSSARYFPQLSSVLSGQLTVGEVYPSTDRSLTLRLTVKDTKGGVNSSEIAVNVVNNQQNFTITEPNTAQSWTGLSQQTIHWNVADTDLNPYNCATVDILLSSEFTPNFNTPLALSVDNDGEQTIKLPNIDSSTIRLMVKCTDNVFYTTNSNNLNITKTQPIQPIIVGQNSLIINEDDNITLSLANLTVNDADSVYPDDFSLSLQSGENYGLNGNQVIPAEDFNGQLNVNLSINDGSLESEVFTLVITVEAVNDAPEAQNDSASLTQNAAASLIDVLANDSDIDSNTLTISAISYAGQGQVSISEQKISYQAASGFSGTETINYSVSDGQLTSDAVLTIQVTPLAATPPTTASSSGGGALNWYLLYIIAVMLFKLRIKRDENHK